MSDSHEPGAPRAAAEPADQIAIIGLGNELMRDDGFGPRVIQLLEAEYEFDPRIVLHDLGTPGLDLVPYVAGATGALIIIDTVRATGTPGEVRRFRRPDLLGASPTPRMSPHDPGLGEALLAGELEGTAPRDVLLVGVIPESVNPGLDLSHCVAVALAPAVEAVCQELERVGAPARRRAQPRAARSWWREDRDLEG